MLSYDKVGIPLVSKYLSSLLEEFAGEQVQLIPVDVICPDGVLKGFNLVNIVWLSRIIDIENSGKVFYQIRI